LGKKNIGINWIKRIFSILSLLFFACVMIQIFLAGMAIFVKNIFWSFHLQFIHYFEFIPIIMLIMSFFGGIPKLLRFLCIGLVVMMIMQYITVKLSGTLPYIAALHPVIAGILFWRSLQISQESMRFYKKV
jgi:hypothetical protein